MYTIIAFIVWTVVVVIGTLAAEYFVVRNNMAYLLRKYAETLVRVNKLKSNIADVENAINKTVLDLK